MIDAPKKVYLYVITRTDMPFPSIAVQSAHAVIEAIRAFSPG
jgi:hypothetical protein